VIQWGSFLVVTLSALAGGCGTVALFSLGVRFAGPETDGSRRGIGIACFAAAALVVALGVALVIPYFAGFFATL
jgi:hypothetical protein